LTVGESKESWPALIAESARESRLASTSAIRVRGALTLHTAVRVALTFDTSRPRVVASVALIAISSPVVGLALALAGLFCAEAGRIGSVAVAGLAGISTGHGDTFGSVEEWFALLAVDAVSVVLTVLADTATFELSVNVQAHLHSIYFGIVFAFVGMLEAVALLAFEFIRSTSWLPSFLFESGATLVASRTTSVVTADTFISGDAVGSWLTLIGESITHTTATHRDVFD
jgi:hypothetical protein